jgi:hypothetical protein
MAAPVVISPDVGKFNSIFFIYLFLPLIQLQTCFLVLSVIFLLLFFNSQKTLKVASNYIFFHLLDF